MKNTKELNANPKKDKLKNAIFISIFTVILVIMELLLRSKLKTLNLFLGSKKIENCKYFEYFEFYELSGRYFLLFTVYNFVNVYAALCFIFLDCFSVFLNGLIRFIYLDPRPFWENIELPPCFCAVDYGNPSTTGINLFVLFATFYKCFTYNSDNRIKKIILIILGFSMIFYTSFIRVLQNIHYVHQLAYGFGIGYIIYFIFFEILDINFDDSGNFSYILNRPTLMTFIMTSAYIISNIIHISLNLSPRLEFVDAISKYCKINPIFAFDNESYTKSTRIFEFLGCYYGVWLEYRIIFQKKFNLFYKYNIRSKHEKFNDTDLIRTSLRIMIMYFGHIIISSRLTLNKYKKPTEEPIIYSILIRLILPYLIEGIFNFFILKEIMRHLGITNETIHLPESSDKAEVLILLEDMKNKDEDSK
jgi:hypothetical protein